MALSALANRWFMLLALAAAPVALLWDNGNPNWSRALVAQRGGFYQDITIVDDFVIEQSQSTIEQIVWKTVEAEFDWAGTVDVLIFPDLEGAPDNNPLIEMLDIVPVNKRATGEFFGAWPAFEYTVSRLSVRLDRGTYWLGLRPVGRGNQGGSGWLVSHTAPDDELYGSEIYWRCGECGVPEFVPGSQVLGLQHDVNFKLYGAALSGIPARGLP